MADGILRFDHQHVTQKMACDAKNDMRTGASHDTNWKSRTVRSAEATV